MSVLAVAPAVVPAREGYAARLAELADVDELTARGWDATRRRFVPAPSDPLFGYRRCPVRGCENVTEHTPTSLCNPLSASLWPLVRERETGTVTGFLAAVTQRRSDDLARLCRVCRTPGHERPAAAHGLCYSCQRQASNRGQPVAAYVAGDARWPPATPRATFGACRLDCDALAAGSVGLCSEHLRHSHRAGRPSAAAFEAWREQQASPLPALRVVDFAGLTETVCAEVLVGLSVAIAGHRRTTISDLRRVVAMLGDSGVASLSELDVSRVRTQGLRLFVQWAQERLRLAFADPDTEWRKDVWDTRVFGKPQAYTVDFTPISQPWLRELAKQWASEKAPLVHAGVTKRGVASIGELSRSLRRRDDRGDHPAALGRADASLFLARRAAP